jgi:hypothetical protein
MAQIGAPQLRGVRWGRDVTRVDQLERSKHPLTIVRVYRRARRRCPALQHSVQGGRPPTLELDAPALPHARRRRRAEGEVAQGGPQVEAGASHDERTPSAREQRVDLGVGELGILARAERLRQGDERDEAQLERRPLGRGGHPRELL